ncbi:MAG: DUF480 domain-containing protein [Planctomycetota bacterium]
MSSDASQAETSPRRWQPLSAVQRRVVGVLIEKAKTTPESYPMTLNALTNGCNQKSNRLPKMDLSTDDVEEALEELRELGAATEVQGAGRVPKYRHYMYDWLGVDKRELAVMAELLLRGEQTIGELRARAARMELIADLHALGPVLDSLQAKDLIVWLSPSGRGRLVTHNLYLPKQLEQVKEHYASGHAAGSTETEVSPAVRTQVGVQEFQELQSEVSALRAEVARLRDQVAGITGDAKGE